MKYKVSVTRDKTGLGHIMSGLLIKKAVRRTLRSESIYDKCYISVMLTDADGIRQINSQFRDIDKETDVLSFPLNNLVPGAFDALQCETDPGSGRILLGDMVISVPRCSEQGKEFGHGYKREVMYLSVHSVLHLLGYDHLDEGEMKNLMRQREKTIMGDK